MIIPQMVNVADLQKKYREIVSKVRNNASPTIVVNNGKPDVVLMSPKVYEEQMKRLRELEEERLLQVAQEALDAYKAGKTVQLAAGKTLQDYL